MTLIFEKISKNNRYGYARVSSKEQAENSSLESQKAESRLREDASDNDQK